MESALGKVDLTLQKGSTQKEDKAGEPEKQADGQGVQTTRHITINNLNLNISSKDIEDLKKLKKLLSEIEDNINSSGDGVPEPAY